LGFVLLVFDDNKVVGHERVELEQYPLVVSTWPFIEAVRAAWRAVDAGSTAVDAVVEGCSTCEQLRCDGTGTLLNLNLWTFHCFIFFVLF
jgi:N4-(beta-N-acetylglucosaminyl)-L-asparaginase